MSMLNQKQKSQFYKDGFLVVKHAVSAPLVDSARACLDAAGQHSFQDPELETSDEFCDLINKSDLDRILREAMGPFSPVTRGFAATIFPSATAALGQNGESLPTRQKRPHNSSELHLDGESIYEVDPTTGDYPLDGPPSAERLDANRTPFFVDPAKTISLCSFSVFIGICLSDQSEPDRGNLVVLKGAHHHCQEFFREQDRQGGPIGPDGPGWPRVMRNPENGQWDYAPNAAIQYAIKQSPELLAAATKQGTIYVPEPHQVLMEPGDAVFVMHAVPHGGSYNSWTEPRMNIYFRLVHEKRMINHKEKHVTGRSDHMVRGWNGEFLEAKDGLAPDAVYETTRMSLLDHWSEWDGMIETVKEGQAKLKFEAR